jgi:hypothetical protein
MTNICFFYPFTHNNFREGSQIIKDNICVTDIYWMENYVEKENTADFYLVQTMLFIAANLDRHTDN